MVSKYADEIHLQRSIREDGAVGSDADGQRQQSDPVTMGARISGRAQVAGAGW